MKKKKNNILLVDFVEEEELGCRVILCKKLKVMIKNVHLPKSSSFTL
jgi:hypothetical protein